MIDSFSRRLRVFLCHSSGDKPVVRELYQKLNSEGWLDVWFDEEKLYPGQDWNYEIEQAVEAADVIIVCLSNNSVGKEGYIQRELKFALDIALEKPEGTIFVIPLRLDDCEPPRRLRGWQYADYFPENLRTRAYQRMLESLRVRAGRLNLLSSEPAKMPVSAAKSPTAVEPQRSQPATPYPSPGQERSAWLTHLAAAVKKISIWKYGRVLVLILLITGFFGPWFQITSCSPPNPEGETSEPSVSIMTGSQHFNELIDAGGPGLIIPSAIALLFLLTLLRLIPWRFGESKAVVRLERLAAGLAHFTVFYEILNAHFTLFAPTIRLLWGFWLSLIGIYLAPINILAERRPTAQKGERAPWWAWLLMISLLLPWVAFAVFWFWLIYISG
jgi:hypothetical protein